MKFLTEKGKEAYKKIGDTPMKWKEKAVSNKMFRETTINDDPLTIEIKLLIKEITYFNMIAIQPKADISKGIIKQMGILDCERNIDYTLEAD